jgi:hypothetical protein
MQTSSKSPTADHQGFGTKAARHNVQHDEADSGGSRRNKRVQRILGPSKPKDYFKGNLASTLDWQKVSSGLRR